MDPPSNPYLQQCYISYRCKKISDTAYWEICTYSGQEVIKIGTFRQLAIAAGSFYVGIEILHAGSVKFHFLFWTLMRK
jgi:hypothetical protein